MTHAQISATGRRKITQPMLSARAALPAGYEPTAPGKALSAFKRASNSLGIPRRVVELVDYLVGRTAAADWQGGRVVAWPSNATLCDALEVGRSQIKVLIRIGQEFGLFEMRDAPNGQRYGYRDAHGRIVAAYGFDLTPLALRREEFEQIARAHQERRAEGRRLRARIGAERNVVLGLCDLALETGAPGDWVRVDMDARRIASLRGDCYDPSRLGQLLAEMLMLKEGAIEALTPACPVDNSGLAGSNPPSNSVSSDPTGPENRPLLTPTTALNISEGNTAKKMDGPRRPDAFRKNTAPKKISDFITGHERAAPVKTGEREGRRESALRGFLVTPDFILRVAPAFQGWVKTRTPDWHALLDAAYYVRSELGISQHAWAQACVVLGRTEAVSVIAVISARHAAGEVRSPGGLLRRMVELHQSGELRLDRSLFGLADGLRGTAH